MNLHVCFLLMNYTDNSFPTLEIKIKQKEKKERRDRKNEK